MAYVTGAFQTGRRPIADPSQGEAQGWAKIALERQQLAAAQQAQARAEARQSGDANRQLALMFMQQQFQDRRQQNQLTSQEGIAGRAQANLMERTRWEKELQRQAAESERQVKAAKDVQRQEVVALSVLEGEGAVGKSARGEPTSTEALESDLQFQMGRLEDPNAMAGIAGTLMGATSAQQILEARQEAGDTKTYPMTGTSQKWYEGAAVDFARASRDKSEHSRVTQRSLAIRLSELAGTPVSASDFEIKGPPNAKKRERYALATRFLRQAMQLAPDPHAQAPIDPTAPPEPGLMRGLWESFGKGGPQSVFPGRYSQQLEGRGPGPVQPQPPQWPGISPSFKTPGDLGLPMPPQGWRP